MCIALNRVCFDVCGLLRRILNGDSVGESSFCCVLLTDLLHSQIIQLSYDFYANTF